MEILYLAEKNRIAIALADTLKWIESKSCYEIVAFDKDVLIATEKIKFYEMHDRIILATAMYYNIPILSSDKVFKQVKGIEVIW